MGNIFTVQKLGIGTGFVVAVLFLAFAVWHGVYEKKFAEAGSSDNLSGFAWSSNIGWISFNSDSCVEPSETDWTKVSQPTAGQIASGDTTAINDIYSMANVGGTLYVGTLESDKAEVYRYNGTPGDWTKVSQPTAGQIASGDTTGIGAIYSMADVNGTLYVGTWEQPPDKAEVYRYNGTPGDWTKVSQPTAGQIAAGGTANINRIASMANVGGTLYVGTQDSGGAEIYRYDGGTTWTKVSQPTAGQIAAGGSTGNVAVTAMANVGGTLYISAGSTGVEIYRYDGGTTWTKVSQPTAGQIAAGGTTGINSASSMADVGGTLYVGVSKFGSGAEIYRYDGGTTWTKVSQPTAGQIAAGGTTQIDYVYSMTTFSGTLYAGTSELSKSEVYRYNGTPGDWTKVSQPTAGQIASGDTVGIDDVHAATAVDGTLYVGTKETSNGAEVYRYDTPAYTCGPVDYGVHIDGSGNFSGEAWSSNIGWIDFAPSGPYPEDPQYSAHMESDNTVTGWAKAISAEDPESGGWEGWIKLQNSTPEYGIALYGTEFQGYAWGDEVIGWVSFNSDNCDPDSDGQSDGWPGCPPAGTSIPPYAVTFNAPPIITLTANGESGGTTILEGETVDLEWTTQNIQADTCVASDSSGLWTGVKADNSAAPETVGPLSSALSHPNPYIFQLTCDGLDSSSPVANATINMSSAAVSVDSDVLIVRSGDDATISWDTGNVPYGSCTLGGPGMSALTATSGNQTITIERTTTFTLDCGISDDSVTVRVTPRVIQN